jgi:hypothetical protein
MQKLSNSNSQEKNFIITGYGYKKMKDKNKDTPLKSSASDSVHKIVKAILGAIPYAGSAAGELFNLIIGPPIEKRKNEWMENIGRRLSELESSQIIILESLSNNDVFINVVLQATQCAIRNNQQEKIEALENADINSALPDAPEEIYQQIYLALIDDLSTMHVRVLKETSGIIMNTSEEQFLNKVFTDFQQQKGLYLHVWNDLIGKQLIRIVENENQSFNITRTKLGHGFIDFISIRHG